MWIFALLAWKRPRLAANIALWWFGTMAVCAVVAAPGRFYLRWIGAPVWHDVGPVWDVVAFHAGLVALAVIAVVLLERSDRRRAQLATVRPLRPHWSDRPASYPIRDAA